MTRHLNIKVKEHELNEINHYLKEKCIKNKTYLVDLIFKGIELEKKQMREWAEKKRAEYASAT